MSTDSSLINTSTLSLSPLVPLGGREGSVPAWAAKRKEGRKEGRHVGGREGG